MAYYDTADLRWHLTASQKLETHQDKIYFLFLWVEAVLYQTNYPTHIPILARTLPLSTHTPALMLTQNQSRYYELSGQMSGLAWALSKKDASLLMILILRHAQSVRNQINKHVGDFSVATWIVNAPQKHQTPGKGSDLTEQMHNLIWAFAGRTCNKAHLYMILKKLISVICNPHLQGWWKISKIWFDNVSNSTEMSPFSHYRAEFLEFILSHTYLYRFSV